MAESIVLGELAKIRYQNSRDKDYIVIEDLLKRASH
jgi:hypothetical protein